MIYFIQVDIVNTNWMSSGFLKDCVNSLCRRAPIKIGYSKQARYRVNEIQWYSILGIKVLLLMKGGHSKERIIHDKFKHLRLERNVCGEGGGGGLTEWFIPAGELLFFIKEQKKSDLCINYVMKIQTRSIKKKDFFLVDLAARIISDNPCSIERLANLWGVSEYKVCCIEEDFVGRIIRNNYVGLKDVLGIESRKEYYEIIKNKQKVKKIVR